MIRLDLNVAGADAIEARLAGLPLALRERLTAAVTESVVELGARVRAGAPRGATGKLASSVNVRVDQLPRGVRGVVKVGQFYGRFLESGVDAEVKVRPYARRVSVEQFRVARRSRGAIAGRLGVVQGYTREVHTAPRPFARPAYEAMRGRIEDRLAAAVSEATA